MCLSKNCKWYSKLSVSVPRLVIFLSRHPPPSLVIADISHNPHNRQSGWQKLCEGTRRKVWTRTKNLSPKIRYFVAILRLVAICALFFGQKQCFLGKNGAFDAKLSNRHLAKTFMAILPSPKGCQPAGSGVLFSSRCTLYNWESLFLPNFCYFDTRTFLRPK